MAKRIFVGRTKKGNKKVTTYLPEESSKVTMVNKKNGKVFFVKTTTLTLSKKQAQSQMKYVNEEQKRLKSRRIYG